MRVLCFQHICFKFVQTFGHNGFERITRGCKPIPSCENAALGPDNWACSDDKNDPATRNCLNCDYGEAKCKNSKAYLSSIKLFFISFSLLFLEK